ncbi:MAG: alpha/beta-type small acid-soluble spore protein [Bacillota bacterium]
MAAGQRSNRTLIPEAQQALDQMKYEVARDLGINAGPGQYWGHLPSRVNGAVGGHMVRRMIAMAEQSLSGQAGVVGGTTGFAGPPQAGFARRFPGR